MTPKSKLHRELHRSTLHYNWTDWKQCFLTPLSRASTAEGSGMHRNMLDLTATCRWRCSRFSSVGSRWWWRCCNRRSQTESFANPTGSFTIESSGTVVSWDKWVSCRIWPLSRWWRCCPLRRVKSCAVSREVWPWAAEAVAGPAAGCQLLSPKCLLRQTSPGRRQTPCPAYSLQKKKTEGF